MNKYILADAIGNIDDRYILESFSETHRKSHINHKNIIKIIAACMACLACFVVIKIFSQDPHRQNTATEYYYIPSVDIINENANLSRTGSLTPITPDCTQRVMTKTDLRRFFQCSDYDLFNGQSTECTLILNGDKTVHTVSMKWYFDEGAVYAIFDPEAYPEFLFNSGYSIKDQFHNYNIAIQKTKIADSYCELDIGIKNDDLGVWIFGDEKCKDKMEVIMNYILNNSISFDLK